jgi:hypothetical protein
VDVDGDVSRSWVRTEEMSAKRELMTISGMEVVEVEFAL